MSPIPSQAECQRCERLFAYFRRTKPRLYCEPCVELERIDANVFFNAWTRKKRQMERSA